MVRMELDNKRYLDSNDTGNIRGPLSWLNEINHETEEKATRYVDESATDDDSTDTEDVIEFLTLCGVLECLNLKTPLKNPPPPPWPPPPSGLLF